VDSAVWPVTCPPGDVCAGNTGYNVTNCPQVIMAAFYSLNDYWLANRNTLNVLCRKGERRDEYGMQTHGLKENLITLCITLIQNGLS